MQPVGCRLFRYEVRRWQDGIIGDLDAAVGGPVRLSTDLALCGRLLSMLPDVPRAVWGRDELRTGEMWSCNSVTSWALTAAGWTSRPSGPPAGVALPAGLPAWSPQAGRAVQDLAPVRARGGGAPTTVASRPGPVRLRP